MRKAMSYEYYKTKLAMKIITKMTRDDAYEHLREPFWKFMEVMINERAHIEELVWEYNRALAPVIRYGLFEPDT